MPSWRCPHCATPQAETSRCWVCHRSSTSCGTCRHFRRSVAARVGFCGIDKGRSPLVGDEVRACWADPLLAHETEPSFGLLPVLPGEIVGSPPPTWAVEGETSLASDSGADDGDGRRPPSDPVARLRPGRDSVVRDPAFDRWVELSPTATR